MGILADKFQVAIDELRRIDAESQIATDNLLLSLRQLVSDLEVLQFDDDED